MHLKYTYNIQTSFQKQNDKSSRDIFPYYLVFILYSVLSGIYRVETLRSIVFITARYSY